MHTTDENPPAVSVIVPVFNDQAGIDACLAAIAQQTYSLALIDIVIIDNGSDKPVRIDSDYGFRVSVIRCPDPGSYSARNAGIEAAKGQVLAFTDADCIPDPAWVANGVVALSDGGRPRVVGGDVRMRLSDRPTAVELYQALVGFEQRENIEKRGFTVTANLFVARDDLDRIGPFDTRLMSGGDLEWSRRATAAGFELVFASQAIVETSPRRTFRAAARQARRVAGGRRAMSAGARRAAVGDVGPRRGAVASVRWILGHPELGTLDRLRVLGVATMLFAVRIGEHLMLALGQRPERR